MSEWCRNHIHLIAVPGKKENLRLAIGEAHRRYTRCWDGVGPS
jgi:hypothetical protein